MSCLILMGAISCNEDTTVTGINLDKTSLTLKIGESETLVATVLPEDADNKSIIFSSSNPLVASAMPNGLITGLSKGNATVVATTVDGHFSKTCDVNIEHIYVNGVTLNKTELHLKVGEQEKLIPTILPENASNKEVYWASNNYYVSVTQDGIVKILEERYYDYTTITVTTVDNAYTATCKVYTKY